MIQKRQLKPKRHKVKDDKDSSDSIISQTQRIKRGYEIKPSKIQTDPNDSEIKAFRQT